MGNGPDDRAPRASLATRVVLAGAIGAFALLGFLFLSPDVVYSGDSGVQFVQARSLVRHRFASLAFIYPGAFLDPDWRFFPFQPPFVFRTPDGIQAIFPPAGALVAAPLTWLFGLAGLIVLSVASGAATLWLTARLGRGRGDRALPVVVGFATPLWFYAVLHMSHAPAVALSTAALWLAVSRSDDRGALAAGLLLGLGGAIRDEVLLIGPGLLLLVWLRRRRVAALAAIIAGTVAVLLVAAVLDVWVYQRPLAAHLLHAVHFLRSAVYETTPNFEVPSLQPLSLWQRYDIVVHQWLTGYLDDRVIVAAVALVAFAAVVRWITGSAAGVALAGGLALVVLIGDLWAVLPAPKFVGGLYRLSPFLLFAVMPAPPGDATRPLSRGAALAVSGLYLVVAFLGIDTTGGKSLGPRLLLPIVPLVALAAWTGIVDYLRAGRERASNRVAGLVGVALVAGSLMMHAGSTIPAYIGRNRDDRSAIAFVRDAHERLVVADDPFTAQLVSTLYFRKIVMLAEHPPRAAALAAVLDRAGLPEFLLISRNFPPNVAFEPYRRVESHQLGRMVVERWRR